MFNNLENIYKFFLGEIEFVKLVPEDLDESIDVLNRSFLLYESVCIGSEINILDNPDAIQARKDLSELCRIVAKDGVSLVAKHVPSNKIISVAFNKVQVSSEMSKLSYLIFFSRK